MIITSSYVYDLIVFTITLILASVIYIKHKYSFWKNRGIPQITPIFPFGNHGIALPKGIAIGAVTKKYYDEFKKMGCKFGGIYFGLDPYLVVVDPSYTKHILTKDFQHFVDRAFYLNRKDPISVHLLSQVGDEWKTARSKFSYMFTSAKLKQFFNTMQESGENLKKTLKTFENGDVDVDIAEVIACYATDVLGLVVFGVEANSFKSSDAIFRQTGRDFFTSFTFLHRVRLFLTICYPKLAAKFGVSNIQPYIQDFYMNFMKEALEYREQNKIYGQDFIQVLIEMKQSGIVLTLEEITSQALIFFTGGFETSSGTASFILYELGLHQDSQDRVREEIIKVLKKHDDKLTYEAISQLTYLRQIFDETLRKHPQLTTITRVCVKDYTFENTDITIKKGTNVVLPILGYHRDADYYPDPMNWDPERFSDKDTRHEGYFPFGDGPRNCIGARFGLLQVILGVVTILRDYRVFVSPKTEEPLEFDEQMFVTRTKQTIYLRIEKVEK